MPDCEFPDLSTGRYTHANYRLSELLWCNMTSSTLEVVSHLNITVPGTSASRSRKPGGGRSPRPYRLEYDHPDLPRPPFPGGPGGPGGGGPRRRPWGGGGNRAPLAMSSADEWIRIATHRAFSPQPHITLDHSKLVTFYHPRLKSLAPGRAGNTMRMHRVWTGISDTDAAAVAAELDVVLARGESEQGSGMDWGATARDVVEHWALRLLQLQSVLNEAINASALNATQVTLDVRLLSYTPLSPYMALGSAPNASGWDLFFGENPELLESGFSRCTYSISGFLTGPALTPQETLLQSSVEQVMQRLCFDIGSIFSESYDAASHSLNDSKAIEGWVTRMNALVAWLDWTEWLRCEEVCDLDVSFIQFLYDVFLRSVDGVIRRLERVHYAIVALSYGGPG